jgi:hypothetical protein
MPSGKNLRKCRQDTPAPAAIGLGSHGTRKLASPHWIKAGTDTIKGAIVYNAPEILGLHKHQFLIGVGYKIPVGLFEL